MPFAKISDGHVDQQLTNVLLAYTNKDFLAPMFLPVVPNLAKESGVIPSLGDSHLRIRSSKRSLYDESQHRIKFEISNDDKYQIDYYDLSGYVPDRLQEQLDSPFDAKAIIQMTTINSLMLEREDALATLMTSTSILTNNVTLSGISQYSDYDNSTPEEDFDTARDSIFTKTGREANAVYMSRKVRNTLKKHPWFLSIAHSSLQGGKGLTVLSNSQFEAVLKSMYEDLEFVLIGKTIKVATNVGQATQTKSVVWNDDVVWFYRPKKAALMEPAFGYSFQLANKNMRSVVRREPIANKGDLIEVEWAYEDNILDVDSAYLIKDAV